MASFCVKCGSELDEGQVFCSKCGAKIGAAREPLPTATRSVRLVVLLACIVCLLAGYTYVLFGIASALILTMPLPKEIPGMSTNLITSVVVAITSAAVGGAYFLDAYGLLRKKVWSVRALLLSASAAVIVMALMGLAGVMFSLQVMILNGVLLAAAFYLSRRGKR